MTGLSVLLQPRPLILTGLPYRRVEGLRELTREARTGRESLLRVTYLATDERHPLPFGADRALLAWITSKAFRTGAVRFHTVTEYLHAFRLNDSGRSYRIFWERFQRIAHLGIRIEEISPEGRQVRRLFLVPSSSEPLPVEGHPSALRRDLLRYDRFGFELDPGFWRYLREASIPTPLDLLRRFHDAPQAWDFAQLLLYRCYAARTPSVIPWPELVEQLGAGAAHPRRLKARLDDVLHTVRGLHATLPVRFLPGLAGLEVRPWRLPMS